MKGSTMLHIHESTNFPQSTKIDVKSWK